MATPGKAIVEESGKRSVLPSGRVAVFDEGGRCGECCGCEDRTVAFHFVQGFTPPNNTFDLTPYKGPGIAFGNEKFWSIMAFGVFPHRHRTQKGCVGPKGELVGLPDAYVNDAGANGETAYLETGCLAPDKMIDWGGYSTGSMLFREPYPCP